MFLDPQSQFQRCLDHSARHQKGASHFLKGDLTHRGTQVEYEILRDILNAQPFPVTLILGNHDRRGLFAQVFLGQSAAFQQGHQDFGATPHPIAPHIRRERPQQAERPAMLGASKLAADTA